MAALHGSVRDRTSPELLVATEDGRSLYSMLGWRVIAPYATALVHAG
ncbi:hypothetical protein [uncultured Sphingomonas sp.]